MTIELLSDSERRFFREAATRYANQRPGSPAEAHLAGRGLTGPEVDRFGIGFVAEPVVSHERFRGRLSIPYLRRSPRGSWSVVSIRFRCPEDHDCKEFGHAKYDSVPGARTRLFNTIAFDTDSPTIAITEGEFDAIASSVSGVPAVGVPGVSNWKEHYRELFLPYETVYILADGDTPGLGFADKLAKQLRSSKIIQMPPGEDVNSFISANGADKFKELFK